MASLRQGMVARLFLAIAGGYWASSSAMAVLCMVLVASGLPRADAVTLGILLVFVLYPGLVLWTFVERSLWRPAGLFSLLVASGYGLAFFLGRGGWK